MEVSVTSRERDRLTIVEVSGELDVHSSPVLRKRLANLIDADRADLVVDLSGVGFLDATGLGVLSGALKETRTLGGRLQLVIDQDEHHEGLPDHGAHPCVHDPSHRRGRAHPMKAGAVLTPGPFPRATRRRPLRHGIRSSLVPESSWVDALALGPSPSAGSSATSVPSRSTPPDVRQAVVPPATWVGLGPIPFR